MGFVELVKESPALVRDTLLGGGVPDDFDVSLEWVTSAGVCNQMAAAYRKVMGEATGRTLPPRPVVVHEGAGFFLVADPAERTSLRDPRGPDRVIAVFLSRDLRHLATAALGGPGAASPGGSR